MGGERRAEDIQHEYRERQKDGNAPQQQDPERPAAPEPRQHDPAADQRRGKGEKLDGTGQNARHEPYDLPLTDCPDLHELGL
jgi:hypothetical protein